MHFGGVQKQKYKNRVPNCIFALYHSIVGITLYKTLFRVKSLNNFCKSPHNFHIRHTHTPSRQKTNYLFLQRSCRKVLAGKEEASTIVQHRYTKGSTQRSHQQKISPRNSSQKSKFEVVKK